MKSSKTTKNNQFKNLIDSSKLFASGSEMQVETQFKTRDANLKTNK